MAPATEAVALLEALRGQVAAVTEHGRGLLRKVRGGRLRTEKGLSVLEVRAQGLLSYLQDLGLLLATKARGGTLGGLPALPRLLETRLVLEKLRPIELRLKYQLEKLLRAAAAPQVGGQGAEDPLRFRPAPANMLQEEEEEEEEEAGGGGAKAPGLGGGRRYVPPRLVPVRDGGAGPEGAGPEGAGPEVTRERRRALNSSVIRELREELGDAPHVEGGGAWGGAAGRHAQMRRRLEESLLRRLRRDRAGPGGAGGGAEGGALAAITHFRDVSALLGSANQEEPPPKKKKKKMVKRKGKGRKSFRRRRR